MREILTQTLRDVPDLEGVLLSTQMHGFVLDGVYVSWQDARCLDPLEGGTSALERLRELLPPRLMANTGVPLKPSLGLCNLYARLAGDGRLHRTGELFTLGSYLIAALTGRNVCHISNAAPLGLVDLNTRAWDRAILERIGAENLTLPEIAREDFAPCGTWEAAGKSVKIYPDYGDQQISILGSGAGPEDGIVNVATAAQVAVLSRRREPGAWETRPYFENEFLSVISNMPAGRNLDVLAELFRQALSQMTDRTWTLPEVYGRIRETFRPESGGLRADLGFYPTQTALPGGSIAGITADNLTVNGIFSAAYAFMAETYWENLRTLRDAGQIRSIVCAGGVSWKNPPLIQAIEAVSGKPCRLSGCPDEAVAGLFRAACRCAGRPEAPMDTFLQELNRFHA